MAKKRHTAEQIIAKLREAEVLLAKGAKMPQVCRKLGVTEQAYYRWRKEDGASRQTARLKRREQEWGQIFTCHSEVDPNGKRRCGPVSSRRP